MKRLITLALLPLLAPSPVFGRAVYRDSLPNGLIILTWEENRLPIVDLAFVCRSGAAADPEVKAGTASLCATMLLRGTKTLSADSIASLLDFIGAQYYSGADFDHLFLKLRLLDKEFLTGFSLLSQLVREPAFPPEEFERARAEALTAAQRAWDYPASVVGMEFDRLLFGSHRYGLPVRGDTNTIRNLTRADLVNFHRTHFVPNNCFIVVVGAVDHAKVLSEATRLFGDLKPAPVEPPSPPEIRELKKTLVKLITREKMNQTYIHFGHPGIAVSDSDLIPVRLLSYILGGPPLSSRLGLAVREHAGLAYDVRCWFDRRKLPGAFHATVQTAKPALAIQKMFSEIRRMHDSGATEQELLKARNYFTGSFPLSYSSNRGKLDRLLEIELYRLGLDWFEKFPSEVLNTDISAVNSAAKSRLYPDRYIMVIMGNVKKQELNLPDVEFIE